MRALVSMALLSCGVVAGCQIYRPQPLDHRSHLAELERRLPDSQDVRAFVERLAKEGRWDGSFDVTDGLSLDEASVVAMAYNADLRESRAEANIALARAQHAGLWDDPVVDIDVLRIIQSVPEPWIAGGVIGFTIPLSGRLTVEKLLSSSEHTAALRRVLKEEWSVLAELRRKWVQWSAACLELELLDQLIARIDEFARIADRAASLGEMSQVEARLFHMEKASREHERMLLELHRATIELSLKSLMGLRPSVQIELRPALSFDLLIAEPDLEAKLVESNPTLTVRRAAYEIAEYRLHLEICKQYPDITIGPAYSNEDGQSRIGLGMGLPIPILNGNRQGIAEARASRDALRVAFESEYERLLAEMTQARIEHTAVVAARDQIEGTILPLAEAQLHDERRLVELGEVNALLTLDTIVRNHEIKVRLVQARLREAQAAIRLAAVLGPSGPSLIRGPVRMKESP